MKLTPRMHRIAGILILIKQVLCYILLLPPLLSLSLEQHSCLCFRTPLGVGGVYTLYLGTYYGD